ncbi:MAG: hypothetical protein RIC38_04580, partial [Chromatocurvus sp.]
RYAAAYVLQGFLALAGSNNDLFETRFLCRCGIPTGRSLDAIGDRGDRDHPDQSRPLPGASASCC